MLADFSWADQAACRDPDKQGLMFPTTGGGVKIAQGICATCPVKGPCGDYALDQRIEHGVWGGMSERERRRILTARRRAARQTRDDESPGRHIA